MVGELFWAISDAVILLGPDGIHGWNPVAEQMFDISEAEALDPRFSLAPALGPAARSIEEIARSHGRALVTGVGPRSLHLEVSASPLSTHPDVSMVVLRDVTSERLLVDRLRKLNEIARLVLSEEPLDAVLQPIVDAAKELTGAAYSALLVLREDSDVEVARFIYNAPRELFPDQLPRAIGILAIPLKTKAPARLDDIRGHPAGVGIPSPHPPIAALLSVPLVYRDVVLGELAVANGPDQRTFDDADEEMLTELAFHAAEALGLASARDATAESEDARRALIDVLRHDIATPIAVARGCVDQLANRLDRLTDEQRSNVLSALERAVVGLERLSANLRSDVKLEDPALRRDFAPIDPRGLLRDVQSDIADFAAQRGVNVHFATEGDLPLHFIGSPLLVRQAIENLLTNAIKYSDAGSSVVTTTRSEGGSIRFDVKDEGPGISPDDQSNLFERFGRSTPPDLRLGGGLGLGLSIVRRVAEVHGGTVGMSSRPGEGSTFWITFPCDG